MTNFDSLGLAEPVARGVRATGYKTPTPIQAAAIPLACDDIDIIGCAQTGTGKTAAFVLPILDRLVGKKKRKGFRPVRSLIVVPTRELALQVTEAIKTYGQFTQLRVLPVYGGIDIGKQTRALKRGVDIIVATPGRLIDHMQRENVDLSEVEVLVLDEADRMLDMGFINDIRKIVEETPVFRQTLMFSATMPPKVEELAQHILHEPEFIEIGHRRNPAESVQQHVCPVKQVNKMKLLQRVLKKEPVESVIVFSRTKHRADRITRQLRDRGFSATALHSNKTQSQRQKALKGLQEGRFKILVATNIASRGIDLDRVSHVINYDTPQEVENYIHRIGRTGRGEATGHAITFVSEDEYQYLRDIERHINKRIDLLEYKDLTVEGGHPKPKKPSNGNRNRNRSKNRSQRGKVKNFKSGSRNKKRFKKKAA
ncbi:MAG: DEAD/DEAH box helicase [Rhodothermaceae bacterium]|nr:DEAD/DEAH box helicase [Rhodothermaceae bacterium]